jgi:hypothetical protein
VATRRIRSDLETFGADLGRAWVGQVRADLRWLHLRRVLRSDRYRALRVELESAAVAGPPRARELRRGSRRPSPPTSQRRQVRRDLRRS